MQYTKVDPALWISGREAARRLAVRASSIKKVTEAAGIRRLVIPGRNDRYNAGDVEKVIETGIVGGPTLAGKNKVAAE